MYEVSRVSIKGERVLTFKFTRDLSYIVLFLFTQTNFTRERKQKIITRQWTSTLREL